VTRRTTLWVLHDLLLGATVVAFPAVGAPWAIGAAAVEGGSGPGGAARARSHAALVLIGVGLLAWWWGVGGRAPTTPAAWWNLALGAMALAAGFVARPVQSARLTGAGHRAAALGLGLTVGVAIVAVASLPALIAAPAVRASGWAPHPNVWGTGAVVAAAVAASALGPPRRAFAPVGLALIAVVASGSRTAVIAWCLLTVCVTVAAWSASRRAAPRALRPVLVAALLAVALGVGGVAWWSLGGRDALARFTVRAPASANLLQASEEIGPPYWTSRTVALTRTIGADGLATTEVRATAADALARVHQRVNLPPGAVRAFSVDIAGGADPGVTAFSEPAGRMTVAADGDVRALSGPITVLATRSEPVADARRLHVTVRNASDATVVWRVGLAPTLSGVGGAVATFRRPALVVGDAPQAYEPTTVADRVRALAALSSDQRLGYLAAAAAIVRASPWWGHGAATPFAGLADRYAPGRLGPTDRPAHAHMLWTDLLVTRGVLGTLGFLLVIAGLVASTPTPTRRRLFPLAAVLLVANTLDLTLWTPAGAPLALAGWLWAVRATPAATGPHPPGSGRRTPARTARSPRPAGR